MVGSMDGRRLVLVLAVLLFVAGSAVSSPSADAEVAAQNGLVVYGAGPPRGVWASDIDKPSYEQLTSSGIYFTFAQDVSPDGNEVLYLRGLNGNFSLRIAGLDGSNDRQIVPAGPLRGAGWFPDGQTVLYWTSVNGPGGGSTVVLIDPDGFNAREVTGLPNGLDFRLSPDGTRLAFEGVNFCWDLMVADLDLTGPTPAATNVQAVVEAVPGNPDCTASIDGISWTPDGSALVYADTASNGEQPPWWDCGWVTTQYDLFKADVATGARTRLTSTLLRQDEIYPTVSPDGTMIAFGSTSPIDCVGGESVTEFDGRELFVVDIDGTNRRGPLTDFGLAPGTVGITGGSGPQWQACTAATTYCSLPTFNDVGWSNPFYHEIEWMAAEGISTGFPDGGFWPANDVTRRAMSAFMYRLAGSPPTPSDGCVVFDDMSVVQSFCAEIGWMAAAGISTGYPDGTYRPNNDVTRQAMAAFMHRLAGSPPAAAAGCEVFWDMLETSPFCPEVGWMADADISTGFGDGSFRPRGDVTRQAMAAFMYRLAPLL